MNHSQALLILDAGIAKSSKIGIPMTIAVVDASTDLVAQVRMVGAPRFTVQIALGKALVSSIFLAPSAAVTDDSSVSQRLNRLYHDQFVFAPGAVPIFHDGVLAGAVGLSGGPPERDEEVASAAAAGMNG